MRRLFLLLIAVSLVLPAVAQVVRIKVDDTIQPVSAEYIQRGINFAADQHAAVVLIELRTPGGLVTSTREIIHDILTSPVPVIIYVTPTGANAASAGFYILESADIAAMTPGTNTGSAHPVSMGPGGAVAKEDDTMKMKVENDLAAFLRSYVPKRGRNASVAESAVRESKAFSDQEALKLNLIEIVAKDEQDLLAQVNGRTIRRFDGRTAVLKTAGQPITDYNRSLKEQILGFLVDHKGRIAARHNTSKNLPCRILLEWHTRRRHFLECPRRVRICKRPRGLTQTFLFDEVAFFPHNRTDIWVRRIE